MSTRNIVAVLIAVTLQAAWGELARGQEACAVAVADSRSTLGGSVGFGDFHFKDDYLSPYTFGGGMFASRLSFRRDDEQSRHAVDASFAIGHPESDRQNRDVEQIVASLEYSFLHRIAGWDVGGRPLDLSLGAGLSSYVANTDFNTVDPLHGRFNDQSWYWSHAVDLSLAGRYRLDEGKDVSVQMAMPVVRLVSRPANGHYLSGENWEVIQNFLHAAGDGRSEFFWDALVLRTQVEYRQQVGERLELRGTFLFTYTSSDTPLPMGMFSNTFLIGLAWAL
jgi:hypothetical protein